MNPRVKKPYPGPETLKELYIDQKLSKAKIAHLHGISSQTAHKWLVKAGLVEPLPSDTTPEERLARFKGVKPSPEAEVIEGEVLDPEIDEQNASSEPLSPSQPARATSALVPMVDDPHPGSPAASDEPETAFEQLSSTQKRAVAILADRPQLSGKELASEVGVSETTIVSWKQSPLFQEAIKEMLIPAFRMESLLMVMSDLRRVIASGKARPEDRKLLAELSGLSAGDQINVNVAVDSSGWFSKRWK